MLLSGALALLAAKCQQVNELQCDRLLAAAVSSSSSNSAAATAAAAAAIANGTPHPTAAGGSAGGAAALVSAARGLLGQGGAVGAQALAAGDGVRNMLAKLVGEAAPHQHQHHLGGHHVQQHGGTVGGAAAVRTGSVGGPGAGPSVLAGLGQGMSGLLLGSRAAAGPGSRQSAQALTPSPRQQQQQQHEKEEDEGRPPQLPEHDWGL